MPTADFCHSLAEATSSSHNRLYTESTSVSQTRTSSPSAYSHWHAEVLGGCACTQNCLQSMLLLQSKSLPPASSLQLQQPPGLRHPSPRSGSSRMLTTPWVPAQSPPLRGPSSTPFWGLKAWKMVLTQVSPTRLSMQSHKNRAVKTGAVLLSKLHLTQLFAEST